MTAPLSADAQAVLDVWFGPDGGAIERAVWFEVDAAFDQAVGAQCRALHTAAAAGALDHWAATPRGCLALLILLDQVPRNLYRGSARAFATDAQARAVARSALAAGHDRALTPVERQFVYLPFEHSEDLADQELSVALFDSLPEPPDRAESVDYARRHRDIIARFGRFPHRNAALGRTSTPEEDAFLKQPGSSF